MNHDTFLPKLTFREECAFLGRMNVWALVVREVTVRPMPALDLLLVLLIIALLFSPIAFMMLILVILMTALLLMLILMLLLLLVYGSIPDIVFVVGQVNDCISIWVNLDFLLLIGF